MCIGFLADLFQGKALVLGSLWGGYYPKGRVVVLNCLYLMHFLGFRVWGFVGPMGPSSEILTRL